MADEDRQARLSERRRIVSDAFAMLEEAVVANVLAVPETDAAERTRRATQSLAVARLAAQFDDLDRTLASHTGAVAADRTALRIALDGFASRFSPMLGVQIEEERRNRDAAFAAAEDLRARLTALAVAAAIAAPAILLLVYFGLVRPLLRRLGAATAAAGLLGDETLDFSLPVTQRDELGLLFTRINQMARRLERRRQRVDVDRARLEDLVDERTGALRRANERLSRVDSERRRFFADVGHELRTPLTVILAETELGMTADMAQKDEALSIIRTRAQRLNRRIDDLLRIARSESGQIEFDRRLVDLHAAAMLALEDLAPLIKRNRVTIDQELAGDLFVDGDADWLRQVIGGLLENAIKYAGANCRISIVLTAREDAAELWVRDDGPGLEPRLQERVFERFARGDAGGRGFGVGLALARWIVEDHGGRIRLVSPWKDGRGTAVGVILPLTKGEAMPLEQEELHDARADS
ncbi:sensor histidine kinase [Polymorphum gilvum]|nr:HAMP domain-containing sensor histidine kinase [Polymorphum gilvum]